MIKINLIAEKKKAAKTKSPVVVAGDGQSPVKALLLAAILIVGLATAGLWWWGLSNDVADWEQKHADADAELERLKEIRKKGEEYKEQKALLARKIDLITELKKRQNVPVHILDQVSRNLPDFLWLDQMAASKNQITINGKATTYNAVTNFYNNLSRSGYFDGVNLGRTFENAEGVSFSLTCSFAAAEEGEGDEDEDASS